MATGTVELEGGLGREVGVGEIERELRRLWEADEARTKASLINLVVYAEGAGVLAGNSALVRGLTRDHACRAILVELDPAVKEVTTRAWITAHCHLAGGRKAVCCEQIAFALTGWSVGRLPNVVFAHLASDLPLVFWWQGELSFRFSARLASVVDRLVFDSAQWGDPAAALARVMAVREESGGRSVLHDLEWSRGGQFRLAIASLFEEPRTVAMLPTAARLRIVHHPAHRCAAFQLLAWFALRAKWRAAPQPAPGAADGPRPAETRAFDRPGGAPVRVELVADPAAAPLGAFELAGGGIELEVTRPAGERRLLRRRRGSGADCESFLPADPDAPVDLVAGQLARGGRNPLFHEVLPRLLELLGEGRAGGC